MTRVIDGFFLMVILAWSMTMFLIASVKYYKSQRPGYAPLINKSGTLPTSNTYYGTAGIINNASADSASDDTITMDVEIKCSRWTVYNVSRVLFSLVQLGLFVCMIQNILEGQYNFSENEGTKSDVLVAYGTHVVFWVK